MKVAPLCVELGFPVSKPGSVKRLASLCGHSSRSTIARALQQPTRSVLVEVGASRCLFGLAPAGVYPATTVTSRAVSSYLTFSPLPDPKIVGGTFSVALSVAPLAWRAQALPGSLPSGARTFLDETSSSRPLDREPIHVRLSMTPREVICVFIAI